MNQLGRQFFAGRFCGGGLWLASHEAGTAKQRSCEPSVLVLAYGTSVLLPWDGIEADGALHPDILRGRVSTFWAWGGASPAGTVHP